MANDVLMVRIYLSEADHGRRKTLMREILSILHDRHAVQGVTVFRGDRRVWRKRGDPRQRHPAAQCRSAPGDRILRRAGGRRGGHPSPRRPGSRRTHRIVAGQTLWRRRGASEVSLGATAGARDQWRVVPRTWRACSEVARALCRLRVFLCRVRAAFDPAPAPVLGMAAADAAPGGGLLCAEAGGGASASMRATPIEAKIALRIVVSPFCLATTTAPSLRRSPYTLDRRPGALTPQARPPTPASSRARDWPRDDREGRPAGVAGPRAARSSRARRVCSPGTSLFALAFRVIAPPNRSVLHAASSGAERGSDRVWTWSAGIVGLLDAIDQRAAPERHAPDIHAHVRMGVEPLGRHREIERRPRRPFARAGEWSHSRSSA